MVCHIVLKIHWFMSELRGFTVTPRIEFNKQLNPCVTAIGLFKPVRLIYYCEAFVNLFQLTIIM